MRGYCLPNMLTMFFFFLRLRKKLLTQYSKDLRHFVKMDIGKINMYYGIFNFLSILSNINNNINDFDSD